MALQIVSKREGFRRCGVAHPATPVVYPDGTFTSAELKRLKAEPMLVVVEVPDSALPKAAEGEPSERPAAEGKGKGKAGK